MNSSVCLLCRQRGVALAYLLWMLAALSLLVASVVTLSITDVRATSLHLDHARVRALGTGAAHLVMRDRERAALIEGHDPGAVFSRIYQLDGYNIEARVIPVTGLVSLNQAPADLLAEVLQILGGLPAGEAQQLGERIVAWRGGSTGSESEDYTPASFLVVEDLLRVPGMTRSVYDRVRHLVHAQSGGGPGLDPRAAPPELLRVLSGDDAAVVDFVLEARQDASAGQHSPDQGLNTDFLASGGASVYCLEIDVEMGDGRLLQQRIWVDMQARQRAVPWRFIRVQPVESVSSSHGVT